MDIQSGFGQRLRNAAPISNSEREILVLEGLSMTNTIVPSPAVPSRRIESEKDSRGRITHWHCSACEWTTLGAPGSSTSMALQAICDAFSAHKCKIHKSKKPAKANLSKVLV